ncbi:cytochrome c oxidase cbb3-type subunit 3 [Fluviicoccus keumensis]|uniref:Cbb3-type cytochrome c oxidase subunit n=1 Tax=Fluviicoccus keumensis TaxID=1435465 RepID=A0A4Q7ZAQ0_9GAMM|nr:cytochrome-c oxidase, cbb3-type subunit III [Fluviicoccus keumensis]RZU47204.1 cytochrome c oxidase cbb3-type subunit 3 [Fluviicoccus keumensis]
MSAFWSLYIIVLSMAVVVGCAWLVTWTRKIELHHKEEDGTTGHEYDGIKEYDNPLPRWWLMTFWLTIFFALFYLAAYPGLGSYKGFLNWTSHGEHDKDKAAYDAKYMPKFQAYAKVEIPELAKDAAAMKIGGRIFADNCAACHGADAHGSRGFPNLTDNDWLYGGEPAQIVETITNGRLSVQGGTKMPAWGEVLGAQGVQEVANYVLTLSGRKLSDADQKLADAGAGKFVQCAACHGPEGRGNIAVGAPNLTDTVWLYGGNKEAIVETITHGRNGHMPAWKDTLGEEKIHLVAAYVYSLSLGK